MITLDTNNLKLPSPSAEGIQIMEMLSEVNVDLNILSDVMSRDPVLAATAIKYANSPIYRRIIEVKSVRKAVNMLGIKNVATIILIATMRGFGSPPTKASEAYWEHSMGVSALSRLITKKIDRSLQDKAELLATIHDIGAITLAVNFDDYEQVYQKALDENTSIELAEQQHYGFDHDDITPQSLEKLKLPKDLSKLLYNFHSREPLTEISTDDDKLTAILSLAHQLEKKVHGETRINSVMPESIETLMSLLSLSEDDIEDITEDFDDILGKGF